MDPSAPLSLAQIPVVLLPIGRVRASTWKRYTSLIQSTFPTINQSDIPLDDKTRGRFFPSLTSSLSLPPSAPLPLTSANLKSLNNNNDVHLTYLLTPPPVDDPSSPFPPSSASHLTLLRPSLQPLCLLAIVDLHPSCTPSIPTAEHLLSQKLATLYPHHPSSGYPLVTRCIGVEGDDGVSEPGSVEDGEVGLGPSKEVQIDVETGTGDRAGRGRLEAGVTVIPNLERGNTAGFIGALMGDMVGGLLGELADIASILESPHGLALLQQSLLPTISILPLTSPSSPLPPANRRLTSGNFNSSLPSIPMTSSFSSSSSRAPSPLQPLSIPKRSDTLPPIPIDSSTASSNFSTSPAPTSFTNHPLPPNPPMFGRSNTSNSLRTLANGGRESPTPSIEGVVGQVKTSFGAPGRMRIVSAGPSAASPGSPAGGASGRVVGDSAASARLGSVLGAFYLLSGRWGDAVTTFHEAISHYIKLPLESIWYASTLEGLATALYLIESKAASSSISSHSSTQPVQAIFTHLSLALQNYHEKPPPSQMPSLLPAPLPMLYTACALRSARLASHLLFASPNPFPTLPRPSKSDVGRLVSKAHGPWLGLLERKERLAMQAVMVRLMRQLGFGRREGLLCREIGLGLVDGIIEGRKKWRREQELEEEAGDAGGGGEGMTTRRVSSRGAPGGPNGGSMGGGGGRAMEREGSVAVKVEEVGGKEGNESVLALIKKTLEGYGVDLEDDVFEPKPAIKGGSLAENAEGDDRKLRGWRDDAQEGRARFGWPELQLKCLRDAIGVAEVLPDNPSLVLFAITTLRSLYSIISPPEQAHLASIFPRALATARRRGELSFDRQLRFWPGWIALSLEISSLPPTHIPVEHGIQDREISSNLAAVGLVKDPFLFNPRLRAAQASNKSVIVQNENVELIVTLQNPFAFELEIQNIRLSTSGVPFTTHPSSAFLPPNSFQTLRLAGFPTSSGTLTLKGVFIRLPDGSEAEFLLPLHDAAEEKRQRKRESIRLDKDKGMKLTGLEARPSERRKREGGEIGAGGNGPVEGAYLTCEVVKEQPMLRIRSTSLTHGAMMLYDGEESTIRLTLENTSHLPVDFLKLSFQDSTTASIQSAILDGEPSAGEAYELESELVHRPVFRWDPPTFSPKAKERESEVGREEERSKDEEKESKGKVLIPAGGRYNAVIKCLGKIGCTSGTVQIDYAFLDRPSKSSSSSMSTPPSSTLLPSSNTFHTRQIIFPILISVYHTLECTAMDVLRLPLSSSMRSRDRKKASNSEHVEEVEEQCLVAVDVRNLYGQAFEVSFARSGGEQPLLDQPAEGGPGGPISSSTRRIISPGCTERIVLSLPRILLPAEHVAASIPSLSSRQFVVSKTKSPSPGEVELTKTLFWYREALLESVKASWKEPGTGRKGRLTLRSQRMTEPMLDAFRADEVVIKLESRPLVPAEEEGIKANEFFEVVVTVRNRLARPLLSLIHLAPLTSSPPLSANLPTWATLPASHVHHRHASTTSVQYSQPPRPSSSTTTTEPTLLHDGNLSCLLTSNSSSSSASGDPRMGMTRALASGEQAEMRFRVASVAQGSVEFRVAVEEVVVKRKVRAPRGDLGSKKKGEDAGEAERQPGIWFSEVLRTEII